MDLQHITQNELDSVIWYNIKQVKKKFPLIDKEFMYQESCGEYAKIIPQLDPTRGSCKAYISTSIYHFLLNLCWKENDYLGKHCKTDCIELFDIGITDTDTSDYDTIREAMDCLNDTERRTIELRYMKQETISVCAKSMGISDMSVSRHQRNAIKKLRNKLGIVIENV